MIKRNTVFVLGAGASAEYGFPLGRGLVDLILSRIARPDESFLGALELAGVSADESAHFGRRLAGADPDSIDTFLEGNQARLVEIGRGAIAYFILEAEAICRQKEKLTGSPPNDHWLRYVWNTARTGCRTPDSLVGNRVTFLTFNYDRILETYLDTVIRNAFNLSPDDAIAARTAAFPIVHLHGQVVGMEFGQIDESARRGELMRYAADIRVIHDPVAAEDQRFDTARERLRDADLVCFLGFGYHPTNLDRLGIPALNPCPDLRGSAFSMGGAQVSAARMHLGADLIVGSAGQMCETFLKDKVELL